MNMQQQYLSPPSPGWGAVNHWMAGAVLAAASGAAWAQGVNASPPLVSPDETLPPRFVLCQREVHGLEGDRKALMRSCLARRLEGERAVQRDCKRETGATKGAQARQKARIDCERRALSVASSELPRAPAPRLAPTATAEVQRPAAASSVVPVGAAGRMPAAGEN